MRIFFVLIFILSTKFCSSQKEYVQSTLTMEINHGPSNFISIASFGFEDDLLALCANDDNNIYIWDTKSLKLLKVLKSNFPIHEIYYSKRRKLFFFISESNRNLQSWGRGDDNLKQCDQELIEYYASKPKKPKLVFEPYGGLNKEMFDMNIIKELNQEYGLNSENELWQILFNIEDSLIFLYGGYGEKLLVLEMLNKKEPEILVNSSYEILDWPASQVVFSDDMKKFCVLRYRIGDLGVGSNNIEFYNFSLNPSKLFTLPYNNLNQYNFISLNDSTLLSYSDTTVSLVPVSEPNKTSTKVFQDYNHVLKAGDYNLYRITKDSAHMFYVNILNHSLQSRKILDQMDLSLDSDRFSHQENSFFLPAVSESSDGKSYVVTSDKGFKVYSTSNDSTILSFQSRESNQFGFTRPISENEKNVYYCNRNKIIYCQNGEEKILKTFGDEELGVNMYDPYILNLSLNEPRKGYAFTEDGRIFLFDFDLSKVKKIFNLRNVSFTDVVQISNYEYLISFTSINQFGIFLLKNGDLKQVLTFDQMPRAIELVENNLVVNFEESISIFERSNFDLIYEFMILINNNWLVKLPNSPYYMCSKDASKMLHYVTPSLKVIGFDQLDPVYNRPDIVLDSIGKYFGGADQELIASYREAWEKRIDRLGLDKEMLATGEIAVPDAEIVNELEYNNTSGEVSLEIKAHDPKYELRRFNVLVNEVPFYGSNGISISHLHTKDWDTTVSIPLTVGDNKLQVVVMNELGLQNFKYPEYVNYTNNDVVSKTVYIGIGVNDFEDPKANDLKYCVQDVKDLGEMFYTMGNTDTLLLTDAQVTKENIQSLKKYLLQNTNVHDRVIISCSSHGLLDNKNNFYLAMHNTNFSDPRIQGLSYAELEGILDSIPARKKLLMIDACNSGENEILENKEEILALTEGQDDKARGIIIESLVEEQKSTFETMMELFVNVQNESGTAVITAAGGKQYALEAIEVDGKVIRNGAFTFSVLEYLNSDNDLTVNGLKTYVENRVEKITKGKQRPTSRQETMEVDWELK